MKHYEALSTSVCYGARKSHPRKLFVPFRTRRTDVSSWGLVLPNVAGRTLWQLSALLLDFPYYTWGIFFWLTFLIVHSSTRKSRGPPADVSIWLETCGRRVRCVSKDAMCAGDWGVVSEPAGEVSWEPGQKNRGNQVEDNGGTTGTSHSHAESMICK